MSNRRLDSPLPYSKVCHLPEDDAQLQSYYDRVLRCPAALEGQAPIRQWEYAMALYTIDGWVHGPVAQPSYTGGPLDICDVGGAGSQFWQLLAPLTPHGIVLVDPDAAAQPGVRVSAGSVEAYAASAPHDAFDILTCLSVIEHVEEVRTFLRACYSLLKPGGLLFLTTDYWDAEGPDTAHFHWMRKRIYNADRIRRLLEDLRAIGYKSFGVADRKYHGNMCYDYSVASIALVKNGAA